MANEGNGIFTYYAYVPESDTGYFYFLKIPSGPKGNRFLRNVLNMPILQEDMRSDL
jgi:hypothetical protein